jgi:hypothetical protein
MNSDHTSNSTTHDAKMSNGVGHNIDKCGPGKFGPCITTATLLAAGVPRETTLTNLHTSLTRFRVLYADTGFIIITTVGCSWCKMLKRRLNWNDSDHVHFETHLSNHLSKQNKTAAFCITTDGTAHDINEYYGGVHVYPTVYKLDHGSYSKSTVADLISALEVTHIPVTDWASEYVRRNTVIHRSAIDINMDTISTDPNYRDLLRNVISMRFVVITITDDTASKQLKTYMGWSDTSKHSMYMSNNGATALCITIEACETYLFYSDARNEEHYPKVLRIKKDKYEASTDIELKSAFIK